MALGPDDPGVPYIEGVHPSVASHQDAPALDRERGRTDDRSTLRLRLAEGPTAYLEGALENAELGVEELAILVRSRAATAAILTRVGRNRSWTRAREIKVALLGNPQVPHVLARQFLPHLYWRDLAELAVNLRVAPVLRRDAEKLLKTRLPELSVGERVALARRGSRGLIELLCDEAENLVLRAVAGNARATEADLARILARSDVPAEFLRWVADRSSWSQRRVVRLAVVRHPRTPPSSALRLIPALSRRDVEDLRRDVTAPRLVRVAAERRLAAAGLDAVVPRPHFG
jgi:hypothetical protein